MNPPIKTLACSAAISIVLLACGDTDNNPIPPCGSSNEMPVMDSRVMSYERDFISYPPDYYKKLGDFNGIKIRIVTDKNILMPVFSHIFENEQAECNYFAIYITYPSKTYDHWVLSQDMVLHQIVPATLAGCTHDAAPPRSYTDAMLVCDDTAKGNLKDRIDIDICSHADPNLRCSGR